MAVKKNVPGRNENVKVRLELADLGDLAAPDLKVTLCSEDGTRRELRATGKSEYELPASFVGKNARLEISSDTGEGVRSFRYDQFIDSARREGVYRVAESIWKYWFCQFYCVAGRVQVCHSYPFLGDYLAGELVSSRVVTSSLAEASATGIERALGDRAVLAGKFQLSPVRFHCHPVCHGRVEVYVRTCCCPPYPIHPPDIIANLCKIIDCDRELLQWPPRWPEEIIPRPIPELDPVARIRNATVRALERADADDAAPPKERVLWAARHLAELSRLSTVEAQAQYIESIGDLTWILCSCSTTKVAEVPLQPDGGFNACFCLSPFLLFGCTRRVQYKVIQFQEEGAVVVYDGPAKGESFLFSDEAVLNASWNAESCDDPDYDLGPDPFVVLERIGSTWADNLVYTSTLANPDPQDGETSYRPLSPEDGLVHHSMPEQPWGKTLHLRFQFHPGLKALGAEKYRVRVVGVDNSGNANGFSKTITGGLSWRKYYDKGGGEPGVKWVPLNLPGGYYKIPYPDLFWPWLGGQFHAAVDTTSLPNGRYLFVVDIFKDNAASTRLVPQPLAAGANEQQADFEYRRLKGPITDPTQDMINVHHKALSNLFLVNNQACVGLIHGIAHGNETSLEDCQFLAGPATDTVRIKYTARHFSDFQWYHRVRVKRGLFGSWQYFDLSSDAGDQTLISDNVINGYTQPESFGDLLSHDTPASTKCTFAVQLYVLAKHTNGSRRLDEYDQWRTGSFALEIT